MPQEQFQRVKQNQNPSPESSEEDQGSTVTACTRNDAIRNQTHDAGKGPSKSKILSVRLSSQRSRRQMEMQAEAEHRRVKETSRARSARHQESNQIATVLNSIHQFKIPAHRLDRSGTAKEINKPVSDGINKDREIQRSERLQQIRS